MQELDSSDPNSQKSKEIKQVDKKIKSILKEQD